MSLELTMNSEDIVVEEVVNCFSTTIGLWERLPSLDNLSVDSSLCKNEPK